MKLCFKTLVLGALSVLAVRAEPVTEITSGSISRSYAFGSPGFLGETDTLTLHGSTGGLNFTISMGSMTDSFPPYFGVTTFTDHVSAFVILSTNCPGVCDPPIFGTVNLDVTSFLSTVVGPYPGPNSSSGLFTASGSFTAPGINIPLIGGGTTSLVLQTVFDRDPGFFFYAPAFFQYTFVPAPEPAVMISTGLGLLALALARRRAGDVNRPPHQN